MHERQLHRARLVASIAATAASLACGTGYVYSAWAPQFADRLKLSSTESNLVGLSANLGMYALGLPIGMFVDHRGPRPAVLIGAVLCFVGYFPLHRAYDSATGSVPLLCFFSCLYGLGGCMTFAAAIKTSALNWPHHRGTATAFPLAALGLSAFFFSLLGSVFFPGDPSDFLMLLAWGTSGLMFLSFFFMKVYPHSHYQSVPGLERRDSHTLHRTSSEEAKLQRFEHGNRAVLEPGTSQTSSTESPDAVTTPQTSSEPGSGRVAANDSPDDDPEAVETSSLISTVSTASTSSSLAGSVYLGKSIDLDRSHRIDIRGWQLLQNLEFWQLFCVMGILAGIGLMTINNIGNDAKALWKHYDDSISDDFLFKRQQLHVSILSICSFLGRLLSGVGSDFLVKSLHASRTWCLVVACLAFFVAQVCALQISNPHLLGFVSGISGLGYGFLFGVYPSIVAESFGIHGLSQNWGLMTLSPVLSSNVFNIFYGKVYDGHSTVQPTGERACTVGLECYRAAYFVTLGACGAGLLVTLWVIRHQRLLYLKENRKGDEED